MFKQAKKAFSFTLIIAFFSTSLYMPAHAGEMVMTVMPTPGTMVNLSPAFVPAHLQGIVIHPDNALQFDFLIHKGDGNLSDVQKKEAMLFLVEIFQGSPAFS